MGSKRKYIAAFTEFPFTMPGFVSVNREENGEITILTRERGHNGEKTAKVVVPKDELRQLARQILTGLDELDE